MKRLVCWLFGHRKRFSAWRRIPVFARNHISGVAWYRAIACDRCGQHLATQRTHRSRKPLDVA